MSSPSLIHLLALLMISGLILVQATQREQEDLEAGDGIIFNRILQVVAIPGDGDKIRLPASAFEELTSQSAIDKGPMFFEVSAVPQQGRTSSAALAPVYMDAEVQFCPSNCIGQFLYDQ